MSPGYSMKTCQPRHRHSHLQRHSSPTPGPLHDLFREGLPVEAVRVRLGRDYKLHVLNSRNIQGLLRRLKPAGHRHVTTLPEELPEVSALLAKLVVLATSLLTSLADHFVIAAS